MSFLRVESLPIPRTATAAFARLLPIALVIAACGSPDLKPLAADSTQVTISDEPTCNACEITADTVVAITGSLEAPFSRRTRLAHLARSGEYAAAPLADDGTVALFDSAGRYLKSILRRGEGPGELVGIRHLLGDDAGRIIAIDYDGRVVRYDPGTDTTHDYRLPTRLLPTEFAVGPHHQFLAFSMSPLNPTGVMLDSTFRAVGSFGDSGWRDSQGQITTSPARLESRLGGGNGRYFVQATNRYELRVRLWDSLGAPVADFLRDAAWFPPYDEQTYQDSAAYVPSQVRPLPRVIGAWMDVEGLVWIAASVADANWKQVDPVVPGQTLFTNSPSGPVPPDRDWNRFLDTVIEVIDPRARRVLARTRLDAVFYRMITPGMLGAIGEDPDGEVVLSAISIGLVRR